MLIGITLSHDYFPTYIETNTTHIKIPLFTNTTDKIFYIYVGDKIFNISVKRCTITYFEYNFSNISVGMYKILLINNKTVFIKFSNESKDYYDELFSNTICYESFEIQKTNEKRFIEVLKKERFNLFFTNIINFLKQNLLYLTFFISLIIVSLIIYFYRKYYFL